MAFNGKLGLGKRIALNLFRAYRRNLSLLHDLEFLFWECTLRCNLSCRHCGSDCTIDAGTKDMPLEDFLAVLHLIKQTRDPGKVMLGLTGGEPLMRPDLEECGKAFTRLGYPWGIVTNGMALTRARLASLLSSGLCSLTVSLDGLSNTHNWLRGNDRSFDKAVAAISLVADMGPSLFDVVTCVHRDNLAELPAIRDLLVSLGVKRWRIFNVFPKGRAAGNDRSFDKAIGAIRLVADTGPSLFDVVTCVHRDNLAELPAIRDLLVSSGVNRWRIFNVFPKGRAAGNDRFLLSDIQFKEQMEFIRAERKAGRIAVNYACEGFLGPWENEVRDGFFFCRAGISVGSVLADGSISACPSLRGDYIQGSIYRDRFPDVWNGRFAVMRNRAWTRTGIFRDCEAYKWCEGNGLHLRDQKSDTLMKCHYRMLRQETGGGQKAEGGGLNAD
jgi:radical SAM protein with 4Fe4S-binding SPASM domain